MVGTAELGAGGLESWRGSSFLRRFLRWRVCFFTLIYLCLHSNLNCEVVDLTRRLDEEGVYC